MRNQPLASCSLDHLPNSTTHNAAKLQPLEALNDSRPSWASVWTSHPPAVISHPPMTGHSLFMQGHAYDCYRRVSHYKTLAHRTQGIKAQLPMNSCRLPPRCDNCGNDFPSLTMMKIDVNFFT